MGEKHNHDHSHTHDHDHGDHHHHHHMSVPIDGNPKIARAFKIGIALNIIFILLEIYFGIFSNSLALLADAGHNASDVLGLVIAWIAMILNLTRPTLSRTFGLKSTSILAALGNSILLLVAIGAILWESIERLAGQPAEIAGSTVIAVALVGVVINGITAYLFHHGREHDLNIKGAYLHMLADAIISLGVALSAALFIFTKWTWIDPVVSILVSLIILKSTWSLLKESFELAIKAVPKGINLNQIHQFLSSSPGVQKIHDLHIWGMSTTENALTAHLVIPSGHPGDEFLAKLTADLKSKYNIHHTTIQIELGNTQVFKCELESDDVV